MRRPLTWIAGLGLAVFLIGLTVVPLTSVQRGGSYKWIVGSDAAAGAFPGPIQARVARRNAAQDG